MRKCLSCGGNNVDDAIYCSTCGETLTQSPAGQPAAMQGVTKPVPIVRTITPLAQAPPQYAMPIIQAPPQYALPVARTQTAIGSCFYHPELPATYVCIRCGRMICVSCTKNYGQMAICPQCYWAIAPRSGSRQYPAQT